MNSRLFVNGDISFNNRLFVKEDVSLNSRLYVEENSIFNGDVSINQNLFIGKDLTIDGNLFVEQYKNETIINTTTTNYSLIVAEDLSINGRLFVSDESVFIDKIGVDNHDPIVSIDIDNTDAVRIPVGTTTQRSEFLNQTGQIRYNTTEQRFEGYNDANSWVKLGSVIDIDEDTYILAESGPSKNENQLRFFTDARIQMLLDANHGGLVIGNQFAVDVSNTIYNAPVDGIMFMAILISIISYLLK